MHCSPQRFLPDPRPPALGRVRLLAGDAVDTRFFGSLNSGARLAIRGEQLRLWCSICDQRETWEPLSGQVDGMCDVLPVLVYGKQISRQE